MSLSSFDGRHSYTPLSLKYGSLDSFSDSSDRTSWPSPRCYRNDLQDPHSSKVYYCAKCDELFCMDCWNNERQHSRQSHEQTLPDDAITVYKTLGINPSDKEMLAGVIENLSVGKDDISDGDNMWFGVSRNQDGDCLLSEGLAYEELMLGNHKMPFGATYPGIVSFVGETGAGKSALINLLIKFSRSRYRNSFSCPVVDTENEFASTSSNVHLYADPDTYFTPNPILYADCEGMGGDEIPTEIPRKKSSEHDEQSNAQQHPVRFNRRKVDWGEQTEKGHLMTRQYMAETLFPRLLYVFSDVVIYMPLNIRGKEDMLVRLIEWAHIATKQSYNKPTLPHLIIARRKISSNRKSRTYDVDEATEQLLAMFDIQGMPKLRKYIDYWEQKDDQTAVGKTKVDSAEKLLKFYYASVSFVNFPDQDEPTKMHHQTDILYQQITEKRKKSQEYREKVWMKVNAVAFPLYVRKAFTQFASHSQEPFDFYEAWFQLHPVSFDFHGAIFTLAKQVRDLGKHDGMELWKAISPFVASCLLLNCVRNKFPGANDPDRILETLGPQCESAAKDYWCKYWPCRYQKKGWGECVVGPVPHHHHQTRTHGDVVDGSHDASHNVTQLQEEFKSALKQELGRLVCEIEPSDDATKNLQMFSKIHRENTGSFYQSLRDVSKLLSYRTCLSCLNGVPEHCLPCGHVICGACVTESGRAMDGGFVELESCPLTDHDAKLWDKSWIGTIKPNQAGLRIMTLDGGGIKGIVEMEILKLIQDKVGGIPVREFFDLIVGTSAGGIIACGLGPAELSVSDCARNFEVLSSSAFSRSASSNIPVIGEWLEWFASLLNHGQYKTEPLERALKQAFPERLNLFGGSSKFRKVPVKIAVTATTSQSRVVVLSNYNRKAPKRSFYDFYQPIPKKEMRLWEAARATSAAPTFFTPFPHSRSGKVYLDGGLYHNNPVKIAEAESKAIWPESKHIHPNIFLSIGTGFHENELGAANTTLGLEELATADDPETVWHAKRGGYLRFLASIAYRKVVNGLNCEQIWHEWLETRAPTPQNEYRYRRITAEFDHPIEMDDPKGIEACRTAVANIPKREELIRGIAHQMIASCFFLWFGQEHVVKHYDGKFSFQGTLQCRLLPESVKRLGQHLRSLDQESFQPHFLVKEVHEESLKTKRIISREVTDAMINDGTFSMGLDISVSSLLAETDILLVLHAGEETVEDAFHLSGFPRKLQDDYSVEFVRMTHRPPLRALMHFFQRNLLLLPF